MNTNQSPASSERIIRAYKGWTMLLLLVALLFVDVALLVLTGSAGEAALVVLCLAAIPVLAIMLTGLFSLQPNEARVLILFGAYKGTVRDSGFHWANPFYSNGSQGLSVSVGQQPSRKVGINVRAGSQEGPKPLGRHKISLRARTLTGDKLKVNDKRGNPIEIAAVVVWRVEETARAVFDVENYELYVATQSETALRHLAGLYTYDDGGESEITLRSNLDEVSAALRAELQDRLGKAGVVVDEARLMHLAYAPEIAQVMLRRQQAEAVIAARQKIVTNAVSMVDMALKELSDRSVVQLDDDRRAAMVSNLMVVLCSESEVHPVVNTGTLYQ